MSSLDMVNGGRRQKRKKDWVLSLAHYWHSLCICVSVCVWFKLAFQLLIDHKGSGPDEGRGKRAFMQNFNLTIETAYSDKKQHNFL